MMNNRLGQTRKFTSDFINVMAKQTVANPIGIKAKVSSGKAVNKMLNAVKM